MAGCGRVELGLGPRLGTGGGGRRWIWCRQSSGGGGIRPPRPVDSVRMHSAPEPGRARRGEEGVVEGWEWGLRSAPECEQLGAEAMRVRNWIRRWGEIARRRYGWDGCGCDASVHGPGAYGSRGESECRSSRHRHTWMGDAIAGEVTRCWVDGCAMEAGAQFRLALRPEVACLGMGAAFALPSFGSRFARGPNTYCGLATLEKNC
ncbi:hypothetical protein B0H14DRAFT_2864422 [Mycena olivaceomarginata]|nr:hypothetical protein B0H14DRAFT_2864422 [Mycena olivaceomarginata]